MSTLTIGNIKWDIRSHGSKVEYFYGKDHAIIFLPASKVHVVMERGETLFVSESVSECLEASTDIVLDDCASKYVPVWNW